MMYMTNYKTVYCFSGALQGNAHKSGMSLHFLNVSQTAAGLNLAAKDGIVNSNSSTQINCHFKSIRVY